jgi:hypothetical protein
MKRYWFLFVVLTMVCSSALPAHAALNASMMIKGSVLGTARTDTSIKANKNGIVVYPATHSNVALVKSLVIAKGGCGDLIFTVLTNDGAQQSVKMTNNPDGSCAYQVSFTPIGTSPPFGIKSFTLSSASNKFKPRNITDFTGVDWNGTKPLVGGKLAASYVYQEIEWTWEQGGTTAADDWESSI